MKIYASYGIRRFIICLGYKGNIIKDYFLNYRRHQLDFTINTATGSVVEHTSSNDDWEITLVDTGQDCFTGGRVARAAKYIDQDCFFLTYGDGVGDINISRLLEFHTSHKRIATLTGVNVASRFGQLELDFDMVKSLKEKEASVSNWINAGFFVFSRDVFSYLDNSSSCILEKHTLAKIAGDRELMMYKHTSFWKCMDTYKEMQELEALWNSGAPWKTWKDGCLDCNKEGIFSVDAKEKLLNFVEQSDCGQGV